MKIIEEGKLIYRCENCDCKFMTEKDEIISKMGGSRKHPTNLYYLVSCPWCGKLLKFSSIPNYKENHSEIKNDENPYPKSSYNSGLCDENGKSVYGTDFGYIIWELTHGRTPKINKIIIK